MKHDLTFKQLAAQCEDRAQEVSSAGDYAQLLQIADSLLEKALESNREHLRLVQLGDQRRQQHDAKVVCVGRLSAAKKCPLL
jgi:hypothetical protein